MIRNACQPGKLHICSRISNSYEGLVAWGLGVDFWNRGSRGLILVFWGSCSMIYWFFVPAKAAGVSHPLILGVKLSPRVWMKTKSISRTAGGPVGWWGR